MANFFEDTLTPAPSETPTQDANAQGNFFADTVGQDNFFSDTLTQPEPSPIPPAPEPKSSGLFNFFLPEADTFNSRKDDVTDIKKFFATNVAKQGLALAKGLGLAAKPAQEAAGTGLAIAQGGLDFAASTLKGVGEQKASLIQHGLPSLDLKDIGTPPEFKPGTLGAELNAIDDSAPRHVPDPRQYPSYQIGQGIDKAAAALDPRINALGISPGVKEFSRGLGFTLGIAGASYLSPKLGLTTGSLALRDSSFSDAVHNGAELKDAIENSDVGSALGLLAPIAPELAFTKLGATKAGGAVLKAIEKHVHLPTSATGKFLGKTATVGAAGAAQGAIQSFVSNLSAKDWIGFDPERDLSKGLGISTAEGFGQGAVLNILTSALGLKRTVKLEDGTEVKKDYEPEVEDLQKVTSQAIELLKNDTTAPSRKALMKRLRKGNVSEAETEIIARLSKLPEFLDENKKVRLEPLRLALQKELFPTSRQGQTAAATYGVEKWIELHNKDSVVDGENTAALHPDAVPELERIRGELEAEIADWPEAAQELVDAELLSRDILRGKGGDRLPTRSLKTQGNLFNVLNGARITISGGVEKGDLLKAIDEALGERGPVQAGTWVFNAPFKTLTDYRNAFHDRFMTDNYLFHLRGFFNRAKSVFHAVEMQSDRRVKGSELTAQEAHEVATAEERVNSRAVFRDRAAQLQRKIAAVRALPEAEQKAVLEDITKELQRTGRLASDEAVKTPEEAQRFIPGLKEERSVHEKELQNALTDLRQLQDLIAGNHKIDSIGEQDILNRGVVEAVRIGAENGAKAVRFPTPQTLAAQQHWRASPDDFSIGVEVGDLEPAAVRNLDPTKVWLPKLDADGHLITNDDGSIARNYLTKRVQRQQALLDFAFRRYQKFHKAKDINELIRQDEFGYEWLEIPISPEFKGDLQQFYGIESFIGENLAKGFKAAQTGAAKLFKELGLSTRIPDSTLHSDLDNYNRAKGYMLTLLQVEKLNKHIKGVRDYVQASRNLWNTKMLWAVRADTTLKAIRKLSGDMQERLFHFALDVTVKSEQLQRRLTEEELLDINNRSANRLTPEAMRVFERIDGDFRAALDTLEQVMIAERERNFAENPLALEASLKTLKEDFAKMRNKHFFPLTRFGTHFVRIRTLKDTTIKGVQYKAGDVIELRTWDGKTAKLRRNRYFNKKKRLEKRNSTSVSAGKFTDLQRSTIGLPPSAIDLLKNSLDLTPEQKTSLGELVTQLSPATSYLRHMLERQATPGFSRDGMRGYAQYFQKFSNYIARETHKGELHDAIASVEQTVKEIDRSGFDSTRRQGIVDFLKRHQEYMMNPGNEMASLRAAAFIWYIGFVAKSAYVNLTQPVLVTYPYLAATYGKGLKGDARAVYGLSKAYVDLAGDKIAAVMGRAMKDTSQALINPSRIEPELAEGISRGILENFLDESFATELGGVAEGNLLSRIAPGTVLGRGARKAGYYASYLFQMAEKINRRVAFTAAFRLARDEIAKGRKWEELSKDEQEAVFEAGRDAVDSTQYEYARWNRPEFMRGPIKSTIFTFFMFTQHSMFFATKEKGRGRYLMMMAAAAGILGLPGAEDLTDLFDAMLNTFPEMKKKLGIKGPADLRTELRKHVAELTDPDTADLVMHGMLRKYGLGPVHLLNMVGAPVPNVDVSGSVSQGRIVPGVPQALKGISEGRSFNDILARFTTDAAGASFAIPIMLAQALASTNPDNFKRVERALPKFAGNVIKAVEAGRTGELRTQGGLPTAEFDPNDPRDFIELVLMAGGFTPTRVAQNRELRWTQIEHQAFYQARQTAILKAIRYWSVIEPDSDQLDNALEARVKYNSTAPRELMITGAMVNNARLGEQDRQRRARMGLPAQNKFTGEFKRLEDIFPEN